MDKLNQFIKQAKDIRLSNEERTAIKRSVLNFISQNPAPTSERELFKFNTLGAYPRLAWGSSMAMLLIIAVLVGGGVTVGAEKALPGDILYPVKVGLNEEIKGWLSVSEESKSNWEVERAQRRLEEAETLAENGSLNVKTREKIEAIFEAHADLVKKRIEKFENKEDFTAAVGVSSKFETSLKAHQKILNRLTAESKEEVKKEVRPIYSKVKSEAKALTKTRKKMELRAGGNVDVKLKDVNGEDDDKEIELEHENDTN